MKVAVPLAKSTSGSLEITGAASTSHAEIQKKIHGSETNTPITSNEEMNAIIKIVQAFENSNNLLKRVIKTIKNETKEQKRGFLNMLLGTLGARGTFNRKRNDSDENRLDNCKSKIWS